MFPTEFAALIAWQHQILFRKTHVDGTLAQHCHSSDKTRRMPRMSWCCAAVLKGAKAAGTKPFSRLHWRLESTRDLGMGLLPSGAWQIAGASPTAGCSQQHCGYCLCGRNLHFLVSEVNTEVWQQFNFFLEEELHRWTQQLWLQTNSQGICSKTLLHQWTTDWLWNISWCNSRQRPCILSVKREQI